MLAAISIIFSCHISLAEPKKIVKENNVRDIEYTVQNLLPLEIFYILVTLPSLNDSVLHRTTFPHIYNCRSFRVSLYQLCTYRSWIFCPFFLAE